MLLALRVCLQTPHQMLSSTRQILEASAALASCTFAKQQLIRVIFILIKANESTKLAMGREKEEKKNKPQE